MRLSKISIIVFFIAGILVGNAEERSVMFNSPLKKVDVSKIESLVEDAALLSSKAFEVTLEGRTVPWRPGGLALGQVDWSQSEQKIYLIDLGETPIDIWLQLNRDNQLGGISQIQGTAIPLDIVAHGNDGDFLRLYKLLPHAEGEPGKSIKQKAKSGTGEEADTTPENDENPSTNFTGV